MSTEPPLIQAPNQPPAKVTPPGAVWSLVLGILSLFCLWLLGSIPAIILGALALRKVKANPDTVGGEGLALTGIITGTIGVFTGIAGLGMITAITLPAFSKVQSKAIDAKAMQAVREVAVASILYSTDQPEGQLPERLSDLVPTFLSDTSQLSFTHKDGTTSAIQYRKVSFKDTNDEPMLLLKLHGPDRYILGYRDGSITKSEEPLDPELIKAFE